MNKLFLVIGVICFTTSNDAASLLKDDQKFTLRGRVIFPSGSQIPVESDGKLIVELIATSSVGVPPIVIGQATGKAIRFPMAFAIKYSSKQVLVGSSYSLRVYIKNKNNRVLYINNAQVRVKPVGLDRTKLIDVPVVLIKGGLAMFNRRRWPDLVGKKGEDAVRIIKEQTGFTNVVVVKDGTPVTKDYRSDRVRVFVDDKGIVARVPNNA